MRVFSKYSHAKPCFIRYLICANVAYLMCIIMLDERISPKIINSNLTEEAREQQLDFGLDKFHISF